MSARQGSLDHDCVGQPRGSSTQPLLHEDAQGPHRRHDGHEGHLGSVGHEKGQFDRQPGSGYDGVDPAGDGTAHRIDVRGGACDHDVDRYVASVSQFLRAAHLVGRRFQRRERTPFAETRAGRRELRTTVCRRHPAGLLRRPEARGRHPHPCRLGRWAGRWSSPGCGTASLAYLKAMTCRDQGYDVQGPTHELVPTGCEHPHMVAEGSRPSLIGTTWSTGERPWSPADAHDCPHRV